MYPWRLICLLNTETVRTSENVRGRPLLWSESIYVELFYIHRPAKFSVLWAHMGKQSAPCSHLNKSRRQVKAYLFRQCWTLSGAFVAFLPFSHCLRVLRLLTCTCTYIAIRSKGLNYNFCKYFVLQTHHRDFAIETSTESSSIEISGFICSHFSLAYSAVRD